MNAFFSSALLRLMCAVAVAVRHSTFIRFISESLFFFFIIYWIHSASEDARAEDLGHANLSRNNRRVCSRLIGGDGAAITMLRRWIGEPRQVR